MLLHVKYLYGIRVEVRGAHHFPPTQPYVVVSNHQSSLDLLGEASQGPVLCRAFSSGPSHTCFSLLLDVTLPWATFLLGHPPSLGVGHLSSAGYLCQPPSFLRPFSTYSLVCGGGDLGWMAVPPTMLLVP